MKGLEFRDRTIRINFTFNGQRCRETLQLDPLKPAQLRQAVRLREQIGAEIRAGVFDYQKTFPNALRFSVAKGALPESRDFASLAKEYLQGHGDLAQGTRRKYVQAANFWTREFGSTDPARLDYLFVRKFVGCYGWPSAKHRNNLMIVLRGILDIAVEAGILADNSAARVKNAKLQRPQPDPLTPAEVTSVLKWMEQNTPPGVSNYFSVAFFSGMRPEELIALDWKDIDFSLNVISVVRSFSAGELKPTKTHRARLVAINAHLRQALHAQRQLTGTRGHVFINPVTDRPWISDKSQREHYWKPALEASEIRPRFAYQTRHTFASLSLMAGANPMWLAAQMGHTSTKMIFERYGKWIDVPGRSSEHSKIETMFNAMPDEEETEVVPKLSQRPRIGRPSC